MDASGTASAKVLKTPRLGNVALGKSGFCHCALVDEACEDCHETLWVFWRVKSESTDDESRVTSHLWKRSVSHKSKCLGIGEESIPPTWTFDSPWTLCVEPRRLAPCVASGIIWCESRSYGRWVWYAICVRQMRRYSDRWAQLWPNFVGPTLASLTRSTLMVSSPLTKFAYEHWSTLLDGCSMLASVHVHHHLSLPLTSLPLLSPPFHSPPCPSLGHTASSIPAPPLLDLVTSLLPGRRRLRRDRARPMRLRPARLTDLTQPFWPSGAKPSEAPNGTNGCECAGYFWVLCFLGAYVWVCEVWHLMWGPVVTRASVGTCTRWSQRDKMEQGRILSVKSRRVWSPSPP